MKKRIAYRGDGEPINVLVPENADDVRELQRLYDAGRLQAGDDVSPEAKPLPSYSRAGGA